MEINLLPDYFFPFTVADVDILDDCDGGLIDVARCKFGCLSNPNETGITNKGACPAEKMGCGRETCKYRKLWEKHNPNPLLILSFLKL